MGIFSISDNQFMFNGEPVRILSGAVHYFRVVPEYWKDRLLKLKACGLNTVEVYIPWNMHEPKPGQFCFEGNCDVVKFIKTAEEIGLMVIVRPGPYICAEWEFGGLPSWLLTESDMKLRCCYKPFLDKVDDYYDVLMAKLNPLLCTKGGPIIAMQIENEYGSYGNDKKYLNHLKEGMRKRGIDVLLFTSDGPTDAMLQGGTLPGILKTVNFGSKPQEAFEKLKEYQEDKPKMCMEYWNGWFDHWGEKHHTREPEDAVNVLDEMLNLGASVNFYMFHGGTNFGFYNGANCGEKYEATVTSYDYDAPISEAGDLTEKYHSIRKVISKYESIDDDIILPKPIEKKSYGTVKLTEEIGLFKGIDEISEPIERVCPEPMEKLGQDYGFILYKTKISGPRGQCRLTIKEIHDRGMIFLDGKFIDLVKRDKEKKDIILNIVKKESTLEILVENMGRVNYGQYLKDFKGITEGVKLDYQFLFNWTIYTLPLNNIDNLLFQKIQPSNKYNNIPTFYKGTFNIDELGDTFLLLDGWTKGVAFINGFNLGRYWNIGPQKTLYVPAPILRNGENEIIILELHEVKETSVDFIDSHLLG